MEQPELEAEEGSSAATASEGTEGIENLEDPEEAAVIVEDNPRIKLIREAEELANKIEIYGWDDEDEPVTTSEIKITREHVLQLATVLEQLLLLQEGEA